MVLESLGETLAILGGCAAMMMYVKRELCNDIKANTANLNAHLSLSRKMGVEIISRISVLEHKSGTSMEEIQHRNEAILTAGEMEK